MSEIIDVAIVGAGAAGLMAAIEAARLSRGRRVVAFDGAPKIGAKILISGGGRCNVTHDVVNPDDYHGASRNSVAKVLRTFPVSRTIQFFEELGVALRREETGKLFPRSDRAADVVNALLRAAREAGAEIRTAHRVEAIERTSSAYLLQMSSGSRFRAERLVLATGGQSVPKTGSDGKGYEIVRSLGHTVSDRWPALVPLLIDSGHWLPTLRGITIPAALELRSASGRRMRREEGSLLFAHFGLSGPVTLDMSRHWIAARRETNATLHLSVMPELVPETADTWLLDRGSEHPRELVTTTLARALPDRLAEGLVTATLGAPVPLGQLRREQRRALARALTGLALPIIGDRGFAVAEVTAGGVPLDEVDVSTMASRIVEGLFLCGEICDVDGRIGGYNFQWAWASGALAGAAAVRSLES